MIIYVANIIRGSDDIIRVYNYKNEIFLTRDLM